ncbi:MAG: M12 family metallo-peptidase [Balneolaceae bacterium]|nr:M12 family metallo-peptidase [Balneolaceae bacterium]
MFEKIGTQHSDWAGKQPADVRYTPIQLNDSVLSGLQRGTIQNISIPGTDEQMYHAEIQKVIMSGNGGWSAVGILNGDKLNSFILSYSPTSNKALSTIHVLSDHSYLELRYDSHQNQHILIERDPHASDELTCSHDDQFIVGEEDSQFNILPSEPSVSHDHQKSIIDVMIVYTPNAESWANINSSGIDNVINQAMAVAQVSVNNSELDIQFRLVHSQQVNYSETGNSVLDLQRLTASPSFNPWGEESAGYMDEVHQLRDQYGADLVALFTETNDIGGIAWLITTPDGLPHYAFSITRVQQATGRTHAHEMGHNFGNAHSRNQNSNPADDGSGKGIFPYSTGWRWTGNDEVSYASVMTYLEGSSQALVFSNPDINYKGVPTGSYEGEYAPADNARSMTEVQHVVEDYRASSTNLDTPSVTTNPVTGISYSLAELNGDATDDGGRQITEKGFCWDTDPNPDFSDECMNVDTGLGPFLLQISNLQQNTQYFVRAFATNSIGTSFGDQQSFQTLTLPSPQAFEPMQVDAVSFNARWAEIQDAERYFLDVSTVSDFSSFIPGFENRDVGEVTLFKVTDLSPGTNYYYRVRAATETIQSDNSNVEMASTVDISPENSDITVSRDKVLATGVQESLIILNVEDSNDEPVEGVEIQIEQGDGSSQISPNETTTNSEGQATFAITNNTEETVEYSVFAAGLNLSEEIEIEFLFSEGELTLGNNYPNPYNNQTTIPIVIPQQSRVRLDIYNSMGSLVQTILDEEFNVGYYEIPFNASGLASGVYFYRMVTNQGVRVEKMLLTK